MSFKDRVRKNALAAARRLPSAAPLVMFVFSLAFAVFTAGFLTAAYHWFPYWTVKNAQKTLLTARDQLRADKPHGFIDFTKTNPTMAVGQRIRQIQKVDDGAHLLAVGGVGQFLELCPERGCIAVEFARDGKVVHAYPFRVDEFPKAHGVQLPYEKVLFDFGRDAYPVGLVKLVGGDLIVTFQLDRTFPFGGGVARIDPQGHVAWYRRDYTHHWPTRLKSGEIALTSMRLGGKSLTIRLDPKFSFDVDCGEKIQDDVVRIIGEDGVVHEEFSVLDAVLKSPFRAMIYQTGDPCIPIHSNYVKPVGEDIVRAFPDVKSDDLVVSLRNISAFAIVGRHDHVVRHMFRGGFTHQHSVTPAGDGRILMYDNFGSDYAGGPSRLLSYDLLKRREETLFPRAGREPTHSFSETAGNISLSEDGTRALLAVTWTGKAYEIRLSDGAILTEFDNLHDVRPIKALGWDRTRSAARFAIYGLYYVR